jgi:L-alanine-DL-glutamate epimerase-like enolase superfamily enzyme
MRTTVSLRAADLHYPPDLQVHTAASGPISSLSARYLEVERSDGFSGVGEVRANISYLSHLPESAVDPAIRNLCSRLPWSAEPEDILSALSPHRVSAPPIAAAAVENALVEGMARRDRIPVARALGGNSRSRVPTNQCLFWGPDALFDRLAARFLAEGFRHLKVRIAVSTFEADLRRLSRLCERAGPDASIAVDANGAWSAEEAIEKLQALQGYGLAYVEQPTRPGDWAAFRRAAASTSIPLMVDEGLQGPNDVEAVCAIGPPALAHLKIVKLGGPMAVLQAMKRLREAGIGVMIGQMNEGAMATAMTAHCVMAINPQLAELYGCYGLLDDPTGGISYADGSIVLPHGPGLGVTFDACRCRLVWSERMD